MQKFWSLSRTMIELASATRSVVVYVSRSVVVVVVAEEVETVTGGV